MNIILAAWLLLTSTAITPSPATSLNQSPQLPWGAIRIALGQVESGDRDNAVGSAGEVSRYQIKRTVWRRYAMSADWRSPDVSWPVAQAILTDRITQMRSRTLHPLTYQGVYLLWNAPSTFASAGYRTNGLNFVLRDRAERFANLATTLASSTPTKP